MSIAEGLASKWISVSEPTPHVLHVELCRKPVNAFSAEFWREYSALFDRITREGRDVRAVVLSSTLPKLFTAGIDMGDLSAVQNPEAPDAARASLSNFHFITEFQSAIGAVERCRFPVIAAIHGTVIGLGLDIVAACDIRYGADNAQFTIKEVDAGLAADIGILGYLPKITGNHSLARELAYTSRIFTAQEALHLGFLSKVVPGGQSEVIKAALDLACVIAQKSPLAVSGTKRIMTHARDHSVQENLEYTALWNSSALQTNASCFSPAPVIILIFPSSKDVLESLRATKAKVNPLFNPLVKSKL
ncbi:Delta-2 dienoyl-CoA isomerase [Mycena venus]|uniref:Delta-2 dienoyl-CoA isomerase n=1 Tax=Mycena venus TaxID=2733690 RepID=A0A8H7D2C0_9AGAR|nr:Delta-2 dienoyl-CoA isomerase [Mycena venus]